MDAYTPTLGMLPGLDDSWYGAEQSYPDNIGFALNPYWRAPEVNWTPPETPAFQRLQPFFAGTSQTASATTNASASRPGSQTMPFSIPDGGVYGARKWSGSTGTDIFLPRNSPIKANVGGQVLRAVGGTGLGQGAEMIVQFDDGTVSRFRHVQPMVHSGRFQSGAVLAVVGDDSMDMLSRQAAASIGAPDGFQHVDLSLNRPGNVMFSPEGGGGGDVDAAQWLSQRGYRGKMVSRTPGPAEGMSGAYGGGFGGLTAGGFGMPQSFNPFNPMPAPFPNLGSLSSATRTAMPGARLAPQTQRGGPPPMTQQYPQYPTTPSQGTTQQAFQTMNGRGSQINTPDMDVQRLNGRFNPDNPTFALENALREIGVYNTTGNLFAKALMRAAPGLGLAFTVSQAMDPTATQGSDSILNPGGSFRNFLMDHLGKGDVFNTLTQAAHTLTGSAIPQIRQAQMSGQDLQTMNPALYALNNMIEDRSGSGMLDALGILLGPQMNGSLAKGYASGLERSFSNAQNNYWQTGDARPGNDIWKFLLGI